MTGSAPEPKLPNVGNVITSPDFKFGVRGSDGDTISIVPGTKTRKTTIRNSEEERLQHAAKTGEIMPETREVERAVFDASRATALFVVEKAGLTGGGSDGRGGTYQDDWEVTARRLNGRTYDPSGEVIRFYTTGNSHSDIVSPQIIKIVGKMKLNFVW